MFFLFSTSNNLLFFRFLTNIAKRFIFMMENSPILAVVVPCYKEEAVLHETHKRLSQLFDQMIQAGQICKSDIHFFCQLCQSNLSFCHHHIKIYYYRHNFLAFLKNVIRTIISPIKLSGDFPIYTPLLYQTQTRALC